MKHTSTRRSFLRLGLAAALAAQYPGLSFAAGAGEARLVLVNLRGGLDGLSAVPPIGDPLYPSVRGELAIAAPGVEGGALALDGFFGLHPELVFCAERWRARELLPCHAVATAYRERSHFDAQNVLESGDNRRSGSPTGWLNRALSASLPRGASGLALGQNVPLVLRGPAPVSSWAPWDHSDLDEEFIERLRDLYSNDPLLSARLDAATRTDVVADEAGTAGASARGRTGSIARLRAVGGTAGRMLAAPTGPRVAVLEATGWDTHQSEGGATGYLARQLNGLDEVLRTLHGGLGAVWSRTVVIVLTEFGRMVAVNGARGTDHGTGMAALLLGGAVNGGRVVADWPGLAQGQLHDGRDLKPTLALHAVLKGVLRDHLDLAPRALDEVFPLSQGDRPVNDLIRA